VTGLPAIASPSAARGMIAVVERASSHPATQVRLLREEYARWNVPLQLPTWNFARVLRELEQADYITVPSDFVRASMIAEDVPERKLIEIPFGVDVQRFAPVGRKDPHSFRAIFAGTVSIRKGVPDLLEAWDTRIASRLTQRLLKNIHEEKGHPKHPEALLPKPEYLIEIDIEDDTPAEDKNKTPLPKETVEERHLSRCGLTTPHCWADVNCDSS
jgi:glycosyltransferase involved in cell wall biosynthesis